MQMLVSNRYISHYPDPQFGLGFYLDKRGVVGQFMQIFLLNLVDFSTPQIIYLV